MNLICKKKRDLANSISLNGSLITEKVAVASYFNNYFSSVANNLVKNKSKTSTKFTKCLL